VRAELLVGAVLVALVEKIKVLLPERRQETIGIEKLPQLAARIARAELVFENLRPLRNKNLEHALRREARHRKFPPRLAREIDDLAAFGAANHRAHDHALRLAVRDRMHAEHGVRRCMFRFDEGGEVGLGKNHAGKEMRPRKLPEAIGGV